MPRDSRIQATSLLSDCSRLQQLARLVVRQPPAGPAHQEELRRALASVSQALDSLAIVLGGEGTSGSRRMKRSVGDLVNRILRRQGEPRTKIGHSIASLRRGPQPAHKELLQGHSSAVSIPDLLGFLQMQGKTGVLRVALDAEVISIHFEKGDLVAALSSDSPAGCRLGEILVELGAIRRQRLESFLVYFTGAHGRLGKALELQDLVSEEELRTALTCQIQRLFHRLLESKDAAFEFHEGELEGLDGDTRLNVIQLLLESARFVDERTAGAEAAAQGRPAEADEETPHGAPAERKPSREEPERAESAPEFSLEGPPAPLPREPAPEPGADLSEVERLRAEIRTHQEQDRL